MERLLLISTLPLIAFVAVIINCPAALALNSCALERPSEVVSFEPGSSTAEPPLSIVASDPTVLLHQASNLDSVTLGLGGSVTLRFIVPIANYPSAGRLTIERPKGAPPCSSHPVRAEISGSIDGVHFVPLGTTCESASLDLGTFSWISHLRIKDITDISDPAFISQPVSGFNIRSVSGPGCLKYAYCPVAVAADTGLTRIQEGYDLSLSHIGDDFVFEHGASFEEYGNGTARLIGTAYRMSDPSTAYEMIVSLTGRVQSPPSKSPVLELKPSAYSSQGGAIDPSSWYYYKRWGGILIGKRARIGEMLPIGDTLYALQIGDGAQGRNASFGASGGFAYGPQPTRNTGHLKIGLAICSPPPSPTPSSPTPQATPQPIPTSVGVPQTEPPHCTENDLTDKLLALDNQLFTRLDTTNRATRLLVREARSERNLRYRSRIRSKVQNLYTLAWREVWKHARITRTCTPSALCIDVHLEPTQAAIATSARKLDSAIESTLSRLRRQVTSHKVRRALERLALIHADQHTTFMIGLTSLPHHSTQCGE